MLVVDGVGGGGGWTCCSTKYEILNLIISSPGSRPSPEEGSTPPVWPWSSGSVLNSDRTSVIFFFLWFSLLTPPRSSPSSPLPDHVRCSVSFLCVLFAPVVFAVVSSSALSRANLPPRSVNDPQKHNNKRLLLICIFNGDSWTNYIFIDYRADRGRGGMVPLAMQVGTRVPSAPASVKGRRGPGAQHCVLLVLVYFVFRNNNYYWAVYK